MLFVFKFIMHELTIIESSRDGITNIFAGTSGIISSINAKAEINTTVIKEKFFTDLRITILNYFGYFLK